MPRISFTANLQRHVETATLSVDGETVLAALEQVFAVNPRLRAYVLDDQGRVRQHVAIFVDAQQIRDRIHLTDTVRPDSEIYVMQALSGG